MMRKTSIVIPECLYRESRFSRKKVTGLDSRLRGNDEISKFPSKFNWTRMIFSLVLIFFFYGAFAHAGAPETGARFLKLGVGARELAMGTAATAFTQDINALYWNPAGLQHLSQPQLGLTHSEWLLDTQYDFVGFAQPSKFGVFAIGGTHLGYGRQEGRGENRERTGDFSASDLAAHLAFATGWGNRLNVGTTVKFIQSRIGQDTAQTVALDLGTQYALGGKNAPRIGMSLRNLGPKMKFLNQTDPLPFTLAGGISQPLLMGLLLSAEAQFEPHDDQFNLVLGAEYQVFSTLALRGGYLSHLVNTSLESDQSGVDQFSGLTGGLGFQLFTYNLDYAFTPFGTLGEIHRFSISAKF